MNPESMPNPQIKTFQHSIECWNVKNRQKIKKIIEKWIRHAHHK